MDVHDDDDDDGGIGGYDDDDVVGIVAHLGIVEMF